MNFETLLDGKVKHKPQLRLFFVLMWDYKMLFSTINLSAKWYKTYLKDFCFFVIKSPLLIYKY